MIKHRNISALIAAAAFGSTALFGCSSKDDPESVADDELKLIGTYTDKFTKAAEQAKKDGNAKACQAVLNEYKKEFEKLDKKMTEAFDKIKSEEDKTKKQEELESKLGSKIQEKMSAMDTARKQCFEMGNAVDPEDDEASGSRDKEIANGFFTELTKEFTKAHQKLSKKSAAEVDRELQSTINGKMQKVLKEIGAAVDDIDNEEIFDMLQDAADDETVEAFEQAQQQYHAAKAKATPKPAGVVVSTVTQTAGLPGGGSVSFTKTTVGRSRNGGGNLAPNSELPANRRRPASPSAPPKAFADMSPEQKTVAATEVLNREAEGLKRIATGMKSVPTAELQRFVEEFMSHSDAMMTDPQFLLAVDQELQSLGIQRPEDQNALFDAADEASQGKVVQSRVELQEAFGQVVARAVKFSPAEYKEIQDYFASQMTESVMDKQTMVTRLEQKYATAAASGTCEEVDAWYDSYAKSTMVKAAQKMQKMASAKQQPGQPSKWRYFIRLPQSRQAEVLFGEDHQGESETQEFFKALSAEDQKSFEKIEAAKNKCYEDSAGDESGSGDVAGPEVDKEALVAFFKEQTNVAKAKDLITKATAKDVELNTELSKSPALGKFAEVVIKHGEELKQLATPDSTPVAEKLLDLGSLMQMAQEEDAEELDAMEALDEDLLTQFQTYIEQRMKLMETVASKVQPFETAVGESDATIWEWDPLRGGDKASIEAWHEAVKKATSSPSGGKRSKEGNPTNGAGSRSASDPKKTRGRGVGIGGRQTSV